MKKWKFIGSGNIDFISAGQMEEYSESLAADVICILPEMECGMLNLQQVILNERYASFGYWVSEEIYSCTGGLNERLKNGKEYELLIRIAQNNRIGCIADARVQESWAVSSDFYTDAYILSRYVEFLRGCNCFDAFLENCVQSAIQSGDENRMSYLEDMLGKNRNIGIYIRLLNPF